MTTLTLTLDDETITKTQAMAHAQGKSVEEVIAQLVRAATRSVDETLLPPITRSLRGVAPAMPDDEIRSVLGEQKIARWGGK